MKKRLLFALALLIALVLPAQTADQQFVYKNLTLGTASTVVNFGFGAQSVLVQNRNAGGGPALLVDWTAQTVTAADFEIAAGAGAGLTGPVNANGGVLTFGAIAIACASATCDVQILAVK